MPPQKYLVFHLMLLSVAICAAVADDLFGMRLTTETLKTKEKTHYRFHYFVKDDTTGDYKTQQEIKEGDSVHGSYTLAEPNGDLRTVTYRAGPGTGFEAKVDIHPSASPMKPTTEGMTHSPFTLVSNTKTEKATTPRPDGKDQPGGVLMNALRKAQSQQSPTVKAEKTEISMKSTDSATESATTTTQGKTTDSTVTTTTEGKPTDSAIESVTTATEGRTTKAAESTPEATSTTLTASTGVSERTATSGSSEANSETTEDPIQKKLDDAENSLPKLPEVVFPDNKTHLKFYKDPEEALLDERITQIARQLAETSLRREYEERKLGHFIPISVTPVEPSTSGHLSKSFKFTRDGPPQFRPLQQPPLPMLTRVKLIPQYIYREAMFPRFLPVNQRLPVLQTTLPFQDDDRWDQQTYETVTNIPEILKINRSKPQVEEINKILGVNEAKYSTNYDTLEPVSMVPVHAPTFLQFFSPYLVPTQGNYVPAETGAQPQSGATPVSESLSSSTMVNTEQNVTKS